MITSELDSVTQTLKEQEVKLLETISRLEERVAHHQANLERIRGAISALELKPKQPRKKRKASSKPAASKADVESALMSAKDMNPGGSDEQLQSIAAENLIRRGFSKVGLVQRFKQVLEQGQVTPTADLTSVLAK